MGKEVFMKIYSQHKKQLKNLSIPHKRLIICFSGVFSSGKTSLARGIERKYKGVRVNGDKIRKIIDKLKKTYPKLFKQEKEKILLNYVLWIINLNEHKNKLIILDSSIDRKFKQVFSTAKKKKFSIFIISIKLPKKKVIRIAKKRYKRHLAHFLKNLDNCYKDYNLFNQKFKADIIVRGKGKPELKKVLKALDKRIKQT